MTGLLSTLLAQVGALDGTVDQSRLLQARQLQAFSLGVHIVFVCFGITMPAIVVFTEGLWMRTGNPVYRELAMRWSRVMAVLFVVGAVSGTVLSFELGILWPNFMATFGDVFGLAFAFEGFAFFIEAIFITIYVLGWNRLGRRAHFLAGFPMIIAGFAGAFFVISVNAWMNVPVGFDVVNGEVVNIDPWATLTNSAVWSQLIHMNFAGYLVCGFALASVYAWAWLRGNRTHYVRAAFVIPFTLAALVAPAQMLIGDWQGQVVATNQPIKLAALEGVGMTEDGAPVTIAGWYDSDTGEVKGGLEIPDLLSILAFHDPDAEVVGLDTVPQDDQPPVNIVRYAFQIMVGLGTAFLALAAFYLYVWARHRRLPRTKWFYWAAILAAPAGVFALWAGWTVTEVGRQPWIVYEVMRVEEAVTGASGILAWFVAFIVLYVVLVIGTVWALRRLARRPLEHEASTSAEQQREGVA